MHREVASLLIPVRRERRVLELLETGRIQVAKTRYIHCANEQCRLRAAPANTQRLAVSPLGLNRKPRIPHGLTHAWEKQARTLHSHGEQRSRFNVLPFMAPQLLR
jgi:hypothetical protein